MWGPRGDTREPGVTGEGDSGDRGPRESSPGVRQCEAGPGTGEGDSSADTRLSCGDRGQRGIWGYGIILSRRNVSQVQLKTNCDGHFSVFCSRCVNVHLQLPRHSLDPAGAVHCS